MFNRKHSAPPKIAELILKKFSSGYTRSVIIGDLEEEYLYLMDKKGKRYADWWYVKQAFNNIPKSLSHKFYWGASMFRNYLKITLRNIIRVNYIPSLTLPVWLLEWHVLY